jgi:chemotaxis protein methyltransferase CheR
MSNFVEIPDLSNEQFDRFSELVYRKASIHLKEHKITLLSNRLRKRLRVLGMQDYDEYYTYLQKSSQSQAEMVHFLEVVTTNESYFWRTTQNFEALKNFALPELLKQFPKEKLMFWSAGCSTGEEPYNLTIELIESMKKHSIFDFEVIASDISTRVVDFAKEGHYNGRKIEKIPESILKRYFRPDPKNEGYYQVRHDIKKRIRFEVENLFTASHPGMHCIFCRNVMIYFKREDQEKLVNRFHEMLKPGGFLFIGHAESLQMMNTGFQVQNTANGVFYRKKIAG